MRDLPHNKFIYNQDESLAVKYLQLEPTNICNADCAFCIRRFKCQKPKNMTLNELKEITDKFPNIQYVKLQGLGECFFNPDLDKLLAHLKKVYPEVNIMSSTNLNCPRADEEVSKILENLDVLYLSIDGGTKETYESIRVGCKWEQMLETLAQYKRLKKKNNIFVVSFTASNKNINEIDKVVNLAAQYSIDELRINPVQDWSSDNRLTDKSDYSGGGYVEALKKWDKYVSDTSMQVSVVGNENFDYRSCVWPFERMYIDVYGNVFVCVISLDDKWIQGNIFKDRFEEIYSNQTMCAIRCAMKSNKAHEHCKTCSYVTLTPVLKAIKGGEE